MTLNFSQHPGCRERHLQRQYHNPLFFHNTVEITQIDIEAARRQDQTETIAFQKDFQSLLEEVAALQTQVSADKILNLHTKIDRLYEQCASLGGDDYQTQQQGLLNLSQLITQAILESGITDLVMLAELEKQQRAREAHFSLLEHSLIADLLHSQSPITEAALLPTLLSETETSLQAAMNLFESEQRQRLCQEARQLLTQLQTEGQALPAAWNQLALMEQSLLTT